MHLANIHGVISVSRAPCWVLLMWSWVRQSPWPQELTVWLFYVEEEDNITSPPSQDCFSFIYLLTQQISTFHSAGNFLEPRTGLGSPEPCSRESQQRIILQCNCGSQRKTYTCLNESGKGSMWHIGAQSWRMKQLGEEWIREGYVGNDKGNGRET